MANIDWSRPVRTKHAVPLVGIVRGLGITGRHRVAMPSMSQRKPADHLTWYLYPDNGIARCDGQPSEDDIENFDPADQIEVLRLNEDVLRGANLS